MSDGPERNSPESVTFLQRWSQRKRRQHLQPGTMPAPENPPAAAPAMRTQAVTDQDLPDIESLDENSEVSMFLNEAVSDKLQRRVLRKLFHMDKFNVCDGLDDYAEDYTTFEALGDVVTAFQRMQLEREELAKKLAAAEETAPSEPDHGQDVQPVADATQDSGQTRTPASDPAEAGPATDSKQHEA